ncbi:MAG TPA: nucleoside transporter C-terminal domain-containing protein [Candidatus Sumerlaeota bacterium]|nr:MAG: Nucleoside permease NupX [candidate division BRC1 bacterium ADurb.Bin183]HOE62236.1 nucleoside transporter C-terminal domain-containing protein [Candidatus Sumerlaeota bacterium]HRR31324.1 nucleoside transporter C-terminal domain-containing protein [Candidatus Sumerlaeia bacterium]HON49151.1 nucleoside transporter C-terminal domain-containing protein [Candidatus Sumerlaeota bacterium]HOR64242.1 nucleoside transporter C-terminal domain-containing protein [Candidatus Sumerlaeota bacterium
MERLASLWGVIFLVGLAWVFSRNRRKFPWRTALMGIALQIVIASFFLQSSAGSFAFQKINILVDKTLSHGRKGAELIFGALAVPPGQTGSSGEQSLGFFLFFQGFPIIIFVASVMSILYYVGIMPRVVGFFAWVFSRLLKTSGAESLVTANNIFTGIESVFGVRPYLQKMTMSELHLLLTAGMATLASSVLGFYTLILKEQMPNIAAHLISASLLSAPAAAVMAKVLYPEEEQPLTLGKSVRVGRDIFTSEGAPPASIMDAALQGAMEGVKLIIGICGLLIAFLGILSLVNAVIGYGGTRLGVQGLSIERMLSWLCYPIVRMCGLNAAESETVARLWGLRAVATEVPAYIQLGDAIKAGLSRRAAVIAAYGLCGFAHVAAMAIFVGGTAALAPERRKDLVALGPRALLAANLACFQTAAVAGLCLSAKYSPLLGG